MRMKLFEFNKKILHVETRSVIFSVYQIRLLNFEVFWYIRFSINTNNPALNKCHSFNTFRIVNNFSHKDQFAVSYCTWNDNQWSWTSLVEFVAVLKCTCWKIIHTTLHDQCALLCAYSQYAWYDLIKHTEAPNVFNLLVYLRYSTVCTIVALHFVDCVCIYRYIGCDAIFSLWFIRDCIIAMQGSKKSITELSIIKSTYKFVVDQ